MLISLIICTLNRNQDLKELLECLLTQKTDNMFEYEIVVVDNNSSDDTKKVIDVLMPRFNGKLRYFLETRKGKPFCINTGIAQAKGEVLGFTDDDCLVENDYLSTIYNEFKNADASIAFMGGKVLPKWYCKKIPSWITEEFMGPLGVFNCGDEPFVIEKKEGSKPTLFFGENQLFRKSVFSKHGNSAESKIYAQDTEICRRLLNNGEKALYAPKIKVYHKIPNRRLTPQNFYEWFNRRGQYADFFLTYENKPYYINGIPFWVIRDCIKHYVLSFLSFSKTKRVRTRCDAYYSCGIMQKIISNKANKQN